MTEQRKQKPKARPSEYPALESLLSIWGRWAVRQGSSSLGYPTTSPMFRDAPRGDGFGHQIPLGVGDGISPEIYALDKDIARLPTVQRVVIVEVYQIGGAMRAIAGRMGVKADAVRGWLDKAHSLLNAATYRQTRFHDSDEGAKGVHNPRQFDSGSSCHYPPAST
jgi:hypothetical protein